MTEIPYFVHVFGTCPLTLAEWGQMLLLAAMPVFVHELLILLGSPGQERQKASS